MASRTTKHTSLTRRHNPDTFRAELAELASQSPTDAAEVGETWMNRYYNTVEGLGDVLQKGLGFTITIASAFGMAAWEGSNEAKADKMVADWINTPDASRKAVEAGFDLATMDEEDQMRFAFVNMEEGDPRNVPYIGIPKVLGVTAVLAVLAALMKSKPVPSAFLESGAVGGACAFVSSLGFSVANKRTREALKNITPDEIGV